MFFSLIFFVPRGRMGRGAVFVAAVCCLLTVTTVDAQSKKNPKQAKSLEKAGEGSRAVVQGEAAELSQQAKKVTARVKAMLQSAGETQAEVDAELEGHEGE